MTDRKQNNLNQRIQKFINIHPTILAKTPGGDLCCLLCNKIINASKDFNVHVHLTGQLHLKKYSFRGTGNTVPRETNNQQFIDNNFATKKLGHMILDTFVSADIPLHKLRHPKFYNLFKFLGYSLPSESTIRACIEEAYNTETSTIKNLIRDKYVFIVVDETSNDRKYFTGILVGLISNPQKTYAICLDTSNTPPNSKYIVCLIQKTLSDFDILDEKLLVLLSDAARYMIRAGDELKNQYTNMFHFTCIAHLFHNISSKISSYFTKVNTLISTIKTALIKSKKDSFHLIL